MRAVLLALALMVLPANTYPTLDDRVDALLAEGKNSAALNAAREAADSGDPEGHDWLGWFHEEGRGIAVDIPTAASHYRIAADGGNNHAAWRLGVLIDSGKVKGTLEEAVALFQAAADRGAPTGMVSLAVMQATGRGTRQDFGAAMGNYMRAAKLGHAHGVRGVGVMLFLGQGVAADPEEASAWMLVSAAMGNEEADANLGRILEQVPNDRIPAIGRRALVIADELGVEVSIVVEDEDAPAAAPAA
jgi:uncharacterized protein